MCGCKLGCRARWRQLGGGAYWRCTAGIGVPAGGWGRRPLPKGRPRYRQPLDWKFQLPQRAPGLPFTLNTPHSPHPTPRRLWARVPRCAAGRGQPRPSDPPPRLRHRLSPGPLRRGGQPLLPGRSLERHWRGRRGGAGCPHGRPDHPRPGRAHLLRHLCPGAWLFGGVCVCLEAWGAGVAGCMRASSGCERGACKLAGRIAAEAASPCSPFCPPHGHPPHPQVAEQGSMLPPGWAQVTDGQGLVYYVNHVTQEVGAAAGGSSGAALAALLGLCPTARGMRCHARAATCIVMWYHACCDRTLSTLTQAPSPPALSLPAVLADPPHRLPPGPGRHVSGPPRDGRRRGLSRRPAAGAHLRRRWGGRRPRPHSPLPDHRQPNTQHYACQSRLAEGEAKQAQAKPRPPHGRVAAAAAPTIPEGGGARCGAPARRCTYAHR